MPMSRGMRDLDVILDELHGDLTKHEAEATRLKRDIKEIKRIPIFLSFLFALAVPVMWNLGIDNYYLFIVGAVVVLYCNYKIRMYVAETKTEITYLESELKLIRG